ncbi:hypothetical protein EBZ35_00460 [bacterium]|nr:hypothetical protein [bacterium]
MMSINSISLSEWVASHLAMLSPCLPTHSTTPYIPSLNPIVSAQLGGGLPKGWISEFGIPLSGTGRSVVADFLGYATRHHMLCLWINGHPNLAIHPPAWVARGIHPERWVVANANTPIRALKTALMKRLFQLVVLDMPDHTLGIEDIAFLGMQARLNRYAVVMIRPHLLNPKSGNPWAKLRVNIHGSDDRLLIHPIKTPPTLRWSS